MALARLLESINEPKLLDDTQKDGLTSAIHTKLDQYNITTKSLFLDSFDMKACIDGDNRFSVDLFKTALNDWLKDNVKITPKDAKTAASSAPTLGSAPEAKASSLASDKISALANDIAEEYQKTLVILFVDTFKKKFKDEIKFSDTQLETTLFSPLLSHQPLIEQVTQLKPPLKTSINELADSFIQEIKVNDVSKGKLQFLEQIQLTYLASYFAFYLNRISEFSKARLTLNTDEELASIINFIASLDPKSLENIKNEAKRISSAILEGKIEAKDDKNAPFIDLQNFYLTKLFIQNLNEQLSTASDLKINIQTVTAPLSSASDDTTKAIIAEIKPPIDTNIPNLVKKITQYIIKGEALDLKLPADNQLNKIREEYQKTARQAIITKIQENLRKNLEELPPLDDKLFNPDTISLPSDMSLTNESIEKFAQDMTDEIIRAKHTHGLKPIQEAYLEQSAKFFVSTLNDTEEFKEDRLTLNFDSIQKEIIEYIISLNLDPISADNLALAAKSLAEKVKQGTYDSIPAALRVPLEAAQKNHIAKLFVDALKTKLSESKIVIDDEQPLLNPSNPTTAAILAKIKPPLEDNIPACAELITKYIINAPDAKEAKALGLPDNDEITKIKKDYIKESAKYFANELKKQLLADLTPADSKLFSALDGNNDNIKNIIAELKPISEKTLDEIIATTIQAIKNGEEFQSPLDKAKVVLTSIRESYNAQYFASAFKTGLANLWIKSKIELKLEDKFYKQLADNLETKKILTEIKPQPPSKTTIDAQIKTIIEKIAKGEYDAKDHPDIVSIQKDYIKKTAQLFSESLKKEMENANLAVESNAIFMALDTDPEKAKQIFDSIKSPTIEKINVKVKEVITLISKTDPAPPPFTDIQNSHIKQTAQQFARALEIKMNEKKLSVENNNVFKELSTNFEKAKQVFAFIEPPPKEDTINAKIQSLITSIQEEKLITPFEGILQSYINAFNTAYITELVDALKEKMTPPPLSPDEMKLFEPLIKDSAKNAIIELYKNKKIDAASASDALFQQIISEQPIPESKAIHGKTELRTALQTIQTEIYIKKSDKRLIIELKKVQDNLSAAAPGMNLDRLRPDAKFVDPTIIPPFKKYIREHATFVSDLKSVIESKEIIAGDPSSKNLVTANNINLLISLSQQYHAHKAVNDIIKNLHNALKEEDKKASLPGLSDADFKALNLNDPMFSLLKNADVIKTLSVQFMNDGKGGFSDKKGNIEALKNTLETIIRYPTELKIGHPPLSRIPITDTNVRDALESARKNYREAFLQKHLDKIKDGLATINTVVIDPLKTGHDIGQKSFDDAVKTIKYFKDHLKALEKEINNSGLGPTEKDSLIQAVTQQELLIQRYDITIKPVQKANEKVKEILATLPTISDKTKEIVEGKPSTPADRQDAKKELELAIAQLSGIDYSLKATDSDKIRVTELRDHLKTLQTQIKDLQTKWEKDPSNSPLDIPRTIQVVADLTSPSPLDRTFVPKPPANAHTPVKRLYEIYKINWRAARYAKVMGGYDQKGNPNEYLLALKAAIDPPVGTSPLQRHIDAIKNRLEKQDAKNNCIMTYGRNKDADGSALIPPEKIQYIARNPKDKAEVDFLTTTMQNLESLQTEMKEIYTKIEKEKNQERTYIFSAFGLTPESFSSDYKAFAKKTEAVLQKHIESPNDLKNNSVGGMEYKGITPLYIESLPNVPKPGKDYDYWTLYSPSEEELKANPKLPVMYTHESCKNGLRSLEDGILSIYPASSDHVLLATLLAKYTKIKDNKGNYINYPTLEDSKNFWLNKLQGLPKCILDDKDTLKRFTETCLNDPQIEFTGRLDLYRASARMPDKIIELIDKSNDPDFIGKRYDENGMPSHYFMNLARRYLERKYQEIQEGKCPSQVELYSNNKPLMQAWQCILENSPQMKNAFIYSKSKQFDATPKQIEIVRTDYDYSSLRNLSHISEEINKEKEVSAPRKGWFS